jgi:hypothetical protein
MGGLACGSRTHSLASSSPGGSERRGAAVDVGLAGLCLANPSFTFRASVASAPAGGAAECC